MDLFRMQCFVHVADQLNLTRAAELAGITQPAMSVQMREIERETGLALLRREKGRIALTPAGEELAHHFRSILSLYDTALRRAREADLGVGLRGRIKTGYHGGLTSASSLYQEFQQAHPDIEVSVRVAEWIQLTNMVVSGELDIAAIERHEAELRPELITRHLYTETFFCVAIAVAHPLANRASVTVAELADERLYMSGYASASMDSMYRQLLSNGFRREQIRMTEDVDAAIAMVASGLGVAPMPRFLEQPGNPVVRWVPVADLDFSCEIVAAWRQDNDNACLGAFVRHISSPDVIERMRAEWVAEPSAAKA